MKTPNAKVNKFEPNLIGFLCNWCSYEGADSAGRSRLAYPANLRIIRVMCSGRIDPGFILEAFAKGADGVLILGCLWGDCHYKSGNLEAFKRITVLKKILAPFGICKDRLYMAGISATDGDKFAGIVSGMVNKIRNIGPLRQ